MKKLTALTVATLASHAVISFAGPPPSKEVVPNTSTAASFFRGRSMIYRQLSLSTWAMCSLPKAIGI